jgi:predicted metal-dependent hydrolase
VAELTPRLGIKANGIRVIDLGNRWGSCSDSGVLNFHWKIMQLPQKLIRYLVAHEVAHFIDKHHSPLFWQTVETLLSNYRECHAELRNDSLKYLRL